MSSKNISTLSMLNDFNVNDEILKSYPITDLLEAYNELAKTAPHLMRDRTLARAVLQQRMTQGRFAPTELDSVVKLNDSLARRFGAMLGENKRASVDNDDQTGRVARPFGWGDLVSNTLFGGALGAGGGAGAAWAVDRPVNWLYGNRIAPAQQTERLRALQLLLDGKSMKGTNYQGILGTRNQSSFIPSLAERVTALPRTFPAVSGSPLDLATSAFSKGDTAPLVNMLEQKHPGTGVAVPLSSTQKTQLNNFMTRATQVGVDNAKAITKPQLSSRIKGWGGRGGRWGAGLAAASVALPWLWGGNQVNGK
jgi:hypothetical protein